MIYGSQALRQYREQEQDIEESKEREPDLLSQIPADAPMDDAALTVWNGERFVAWDKWLATAPILVEEAPPKEPKAVPVADPRPRGSEQQKGLWE
jgi:hypothetical protein